MAGIIASTLPMMLVTPVPQAATVQAPAPKVTTQAFEAWELRCETIEKPKPDKRCGVVSSITVKSPEGKSAVAAVVMVRPVPGATGYQLSVRLPNIVWLPPGVALVDAAGRKLVALPFVTCETDACQAGEIVTSDRIEAMTRADALTAVYELKTRKQVKLSFSMKGFAKAIAALNR